MLTFAQIINEVDYYALTNLGTGKCINGIYPHGVVLKKGDFTAHGESYKSLEDAVQVTWLELNGKINAE